LLDFDHAQIPFGLIVVKIYAQVFQEGPDGIEVFAQAIEEITCGMLFDAPPLTRGACARGWASILTAVHARDDDLVWRRSKLQALALVSRVSSRLLSARFPQTPGLAHKAIGGRGQVTIMAVFPLPLFQSLQTLLQLHDQGILLSHVACWTPISSSC
jgi:hypothetical protein